MKTLEKSKIRSQNLERYAKTERNILSYVRHPYIVSLHYAFQTPSFLVLVLQYCSNGNLQKLISTERRLKEPLAQLYTAELLLALGYLHQRKIVFRDLKPDNVVLDESWHAMLTDFGLSKEGVDSNNATTFCGSVAFLAPEILLRRPHGHPVDIYNLGVLLFDMLTGMPPFYAANRKVLFDNIARANLEMPVCISPRAASLIKALMHRDPSCRLGARLTEDVQVHNFFEGLDFAAVDKREVPVPCALLRRRTSSSSQSRSLGTAPPPRPLLSEVSATSAGAGAADDNDKAWGRREKGGHRGGGGGGDRSRAGGGKDEVAGIPGWEFAAGSPAR